MKIKVWGLRFLSAVKKQCDGYEVFYSKAYIGLITYYFGTLLVGRRMP